VYDVIIQKYEEQLNGIIRSNWTEVYDVIVQKYEEQLNGSVRSNWTEVLGTVYTKSITETRFEDLMAVTTTTTLFWHVTSHWGKQDHPKPLYTSARQQIKSTPSTAHWFYVAISPFYCKYLGGHKDKKWFLIYSRNNFNRTDEDGGLLTISINRPSFTKRLIYFCFN
jgi:hypothetical protein